MILAPPLNGRLGCGAPPTHTSNQVHQRRSITDAMTTTHKYALQPSYIYISLSFMQYNYIDAN